MHIPHPHHVLSFVCLLTTFACAPGTLVAGRPAADAGQEEVVNDGDAVDLLDGGWMGNDGGMDARLPVEGPRLTESWGIREVTLYQSVAHVIAGLGEAEAPAEGLVDRTPFAPLIADQPASLSITLGERSAELSNSPRFLRVQVSLSVLGTVRHLEKVVEVEGTTQLETRFLLPQELLRPGLSLSVALLAVDPTEGSGLSASTSVASSARYPADGHLRELGIQDDPGVLDLLLVPMLDERDPEATLADTSDARISEIQAYLQAIFPQARVQIRVHSPLILEPGSSSYPRISLGEVNLQLLALRAEEGADRGTYYYGMVRPSIERAAYCRRGCTSGQAYVVTDPDDAHLRVGSGLAYGGARSLSTMAHELGHMHGRRHAPCEARRVDSDYPYSGGSIGQGGWDRRDNRHLSAEVATDIMGYCDDRWISDYTYRALWERHLAIDAQRSTERALSSASAQTPHRVLNIDPGGIAHWGPRLRAPASGSLVHWRDTQGRPLGFGRGTRLLQDHGRNVHFLLPTPPPGAAWVELPDEGVIALPRPV